MRCEIIGKCELYLGDCMDYIVGLPDKAFDLAIVDPPYGIGKDRKCWQRESRGGRIPSRVYDDKDWDKKMPKSYYQELFRVSKNQIIWGFQYFLEDINKNTEKIIVWDKQNNGFSCSDFEAAWTSFKGKSDLFSYCWIGYSQGVIGRSTPKYGKEERIHPTQKPVALYKWLLHNYAKPGWWILDTHGGSFSSAVAAYEMGFDYVGIELDKEYYEKSVERLRQATLQPFLLN